MMNSKDMPEAQKEEIPYCQNDDPVFVEEREERRQAGIRAKSERGNRSGGIGGRDVRPVYHRRLQQGRNE